MKDFDEPGHLAPTGMHLGEIKYMVIQGEPGAVIRGKKVTLYTRRVGLNCRFKPAPQHIKYLCNFILYDL